MTTNIEIPMNEHDGKPEIVDGMKGRFIGGFKWNEQYIDDVYGECWVDRTVPWGLCKKIYQEMAMYASEEMSRKVTNENNKS